MDHLLASDRLTRFVAGDLDEVSSRSVQAHLTECEACRTWVATYRQLAGELRPAGVAGPEPVHPASAQLALLALAPQAMEEAELARCEEHLDCCAPCRGEVALARAAAAVSRSHEEGMPTFARRARRPLRSSSLRWAVGLLAVAGGLAVGWSATRVPETLEVAHSTLSKTETLKAKQSILISETTVEPGAHLTLETGSTVALGEGFSIASGASLRVTVGERRGLKL